MGPATSIGLVHTGVKIVSGVNTIFWNNQFYFMWGGLKNPVVVGVVGKLLFYFMWGGLKSTVVVGVVGKPRAKRPSESTNSERRVMKPGL